VNNWSVGGRLRHVEVKTHFLRELKEQGLIVVMIDGPSVTGVREGPSRVFHTRPDQDQTKTENRRRTEGAKVITIRASRAT
jgi:hypothetical protein